MHGLQAPNAGVGEAVKLYTTTVPATRLNDTQKTRGALKLGVGRQRKQKSYCAPLQNGVEAVKLVDRDVKIA